MMTEREQVRVLKRAAEGGYFGRLHRGWMDKDVTCEEMTANLVAKLDALLGEPARAKACETLLNLVVYDRPMIAEALGRTILFRMGRLRECGVDAEGRSYAYLSSRKRP